MTSLFTRTLVLLLVLAFVLVPANVSAQTQPDPPPYVTVYKGTFTNASYEIVVPNPISNWNGTLLVYAHGYAFGSETAAGDLSGTPAYDLAGANYAVAGSAYRNTGWAVKEGLQNTLALTNRFNGLVGKPQQTILIGFSMGSVIALKGIEQYPGIYDGAISACGIGGGTPVAVDMALDLALAYDVTFGWPSEWGTPGDVKDSLKFADPVVQAVLTQNLQDLKSADPQTKVMTQTKFEFIRLVLDLPPEDFYPDPGYPDLPGAKPGGFLVDMYFATEARAEIEQRANGAVSQNLDHVYSIPSGVIQAATVFVDEPALSGDNPVSWLREMNCDLGNKYEAKRSAREYVERYAAFSGDLKRPVLTLHTTIDPINPPFHERLYSETVNAAVGEEKKNELLLQLYTDRLGHCEFTDEQPVAAINGMMWRLTNGYWPDRYVFEQWTPDDPSDLDVEVFNFDYPVPQPYYRSAPAACEFGAARQEGAAGGASMYLPVTSK